jgi:hypothetical protein
MQVLNASLTPGVLQAGWPGIWFRVFIFVFLLLFSQIECWFCKIRISRFVDPFEVIPSLLGSE